MQVLDHQEQRPALPARPSTPRSSSNRRAFPNAPVGPGRVRVAQVGHQPRQLAARRPEHLVELGGLEPRRQRPQRCRRPARTAARPRPARCSGRPAPARRRPAPRAASSATSRLLPTPASPATSTVAGAPAGRALERRAQRRQLGGAPDERPGHGDIIAQRRPPPARGRPWRRQMPAAITTWGGTVRPRARRRGGGNARPVRHTRGDVRPARPRGGGTARPARDHAAAGAARPTRPRGDAVRPGTTTRPRRRAPAHPRPRRRATAQLRERRQPEPASRQAAQRPLTTTSAWSAAKPWSCAAQRRGEALPPGRSSTRPQRRQTAWSWRSVRGRRAPRPRPCRAGARGRAARRAPAWRRSWNRRARQLLGAATSAPARRSGARRGRAAGGG